MAEIAIITFRKERGLRTMEKVIKITVDRNGKILVEGLTGQGLWLTIAGIAIDPKTFRLPSSDTELILYGEMLK